MGVTDPITSRANPFLKELRRLAQGSVAYRKQGQFWLEGEHLVAAALARGRRLQTLVLTQSAQGGSVSQWRDAADRTVVVADDLWREFTALDSPARVGAVLSWAPGPFWRPDVATVVLDRVQDAGNVGAILRSAAAFGVAQVLAIQGSAALWSPKVLRAGMGAHFALDLFEGLNADELTALKVPLLVTSSHEGQFLHAQELPWPCAWVFGHEGQGVAPDLMAGATRSVRIIQPGGEESLNVAAAAAICLHASAVSAVGRGASAAPAGL
jgi:RNA methyltransferase, TrmH family